MMYSSKCIAPPSVAPICTFTTGMPGRKRQYPCPWPSVTNIPEKSSRWAARCAAFIPAIAYPARDISLAGIAAIAAPAGVNPPGAFAEYLTIPASNVFTLPAAIDDEIAAILDPLGNATHTALAFNVVGEDVLITGAGPIGVMAVAIARHCGARHVVITDVNDYRLDLAKKMGASRALNISRESLDEAMRDLGMEEGFDVGFEMSGNPAALRELLRTMNNGGSVPMPGIPPGEPGIDWNQVIFKGLTIKGIYGREMFETWYKMSSMLQSGLDIRPVITHRLGINDYQQGFEIMNSGKSGKVTLDWTSL